jgi:hypothetical protein
MEARVNQAVFWFEKVVSANPELGPQPHARHAAAYTFNSEAQRAARLPLG